MKKKNMDYFEAARKNKLTPFGDVDRDGVKNVFDCKPYDPKRDGILGRVVNVVSGGRYGQSRDEYEAERRNRPLIREQHRVERRAERQEERETYRKAYREAKLERIRKQGKAAGGTSWTDRFNSLAGSSSIPRSRLRYSTHDNYNPIGYMFDTGMSKPRKIKTSAVKTKYAVVGGKAYPIAGIDKKKSKKKRSIGFSGYDMTDNYGFLK